MKSYRVLFGLALVFGMSAAPLQSFAQEGEGGGIVGQSATVEARKQIQALKAQELAAKMQLDRARARVVMAFKTQNPEYATAEAEATKAKTEMDQAKAAAQTAVRSTPEYLKSAGAKAAAQEKFRSLQDTRGSDAEMNALLNEFTQHATLLNRMETDAVAKDARYNDAKARHFEAARTLESFKAQIDDACLLDPDYLALEQAWLATQDQVAQAELSLKNMVMAERQARAAEAKARAAERSSRSKGGE